MCTTPRQRMLAPEESGTDGRSSGHYKRISKSQPAPLIGSPGDMST